MGARIRRLMVIAVTGFALVASSCSSGGTADTGDSAIADPTATPSAVTVAPSPTIGPTSSPAVETTPTPLATPTVLEDPVPPAGAAPAAGPEAGDPSPPATEAPSPTRQTPDRPIPTPADGTTPARPVAAALVVEVLERLGHDTTAFTQGLEFHEGRLFESRGRYGQSALTEIDPITGVVLRRVGVPDEFFAEGITVVDDRIIQITWREERAFVYDIDTFAVVDQFTYRGEGWGLCLDETGAGRRLVMSDGSDVLTFRDPGTFVATGSVDVTLNGTPLENLNELECVDGLVWANVWRTDSIVVIDPATGAVVSVVDGSDLLTPSERAGVDVLNGIARDHGTGRWLITGKLWPAMFVVDFVTG